MLCLGSSLRVSGLSRDELEAMVAERSSKIPDTNDINQGNSTVSELVIENSDKNP